ncbi:50S ribosomal protein L21e [Candidatus Pacearchaeota archaeon]|nr:50S ribosomal protein L21e [Candidatus Pacearchaeota archaeon]
MADRKPIRTRGKIQFSRYFQELKKGDFVAISRELAVRANFSKRLQGITGVVDGKRGKVYLVKIKDGNKEKTILAAPIHLKKIKQVKK